MDAVLTRWTPCWSANEVSPHRHVLERQRHGAVSPPSQCGTTNTPPPPPTHPPTPSLPLPSCWRRRGAASPHPPCPCPMPCPQKRRPWGGRPRGENGPARGRAAGEPPSPQVLGAHAGGRCALRGRCRYRLPAVRGPFQWPLQNPRGSGSVLLHVDTRYNARLLLAARQWPWPVQHQHQHQHHQTGGQLVSS
jgi:hypothetical protein